MSEFSRSNKITGIHWHKIPIENIKIRVKLKAQDSIAALPKFEDYTNEANNLNLENSIDEYSFKWQEKRFSSWEFKYYGDILNCVTDLELTYNNMVNNTENGQKVFSYIHDDYYLPLPLDEVKDNELKTKSFLTKVNEKLQRVFDDDSVSLRHLLKSEENLCVDKEQWTAMHIVFDNSAYDEDAELLIKQEIVLLSLYHNESKKYLILSPDANDLEMNPYTIELETGMALDYLYSVEVIRVCNETAGDDEDDELVMLLQKLYDKWETKQKHLINFIIPPRGKKQFYITLEILTAKKFEMDNIYIEYHVKLPEGVNCSDTLHGRTHISEALRNEDVAVWNYGHMVELSLEVDNSFEPPPVKLFFEAISIDWWGRHRTEGYSHLSLPLTKGENARQLSCLRPEELHQAAADSRRFFVGGCHLIKDLDVLIHPEDPTFISVSTGIISVRWSTICQSSTLHKGTLPTPRSGAASALLVGAETALSQYRKARAKLKAVTRDLEAGDG